MLHLPRSRVVVQAPRMGGGFGGKVAVGNLSDMLAQITATQEPFYAAGARTYDFVHSYTGRGLDELHLEYTPIDVRGMEQ